MGLVIEILKIEASLHDSNADNVYLFAEVIADELNRVGIAESASIGSTRGLANFAMQASTPPAHPR